MTPTEWLIGYISGGGDFLFAERALNLHGIEVYIPTARHTRRLRGKGPPRYEEYDRPALGNYAFIPYCDGWQKLLHLDQLDYVITRRDAVLRLPNKVIERIRMLEADGTWDVKSDIPRRISAGDTIRITTGSMRGAEGLVSYVKGSKWVYAVIDGEVERIPRVIVEIV